MSIEQASSASHVSLSPFGEPLEITNASMIYVVNDDVGAGSFILTQWVDTNLQEVENEVHCDQIPISEENVGIEATAQLNIVVVGDAVSIENTGPTRLSIGWDTRIQTRM